MAAREVVKRLEKLGFRRVSQRGSHLKLQQERGGKVYTVVVRCTDSISPSWFWAEFFNKPGSSGTSSIEYDNNLRAGRIPTFSSFP